MTVFDSALPFPLDRLKARGHTVFTAGLRNLNIVGVRSPARQANGFDDRLHVIYKETPTQWMARSWPITTDPGLAYLEHPSRSGGCAILLPGQYLGSHVIGLHRGRYAALVQDRPMSFVRDGNHDAILDTADLPVANAVIGLNIHASDNNPFDSQDQVRAEVGPWSAACQVFQASKDYREFWELIVRASHVWGKRFSYTLLQDE